MGDKVPRLTSWQGMRDSLGGRGVTGYAQMLLVHGRFGYADFLLKSADELIDDQYTDRLQVAYEANA